MGTYTLRFLQFGEISANGDAVQVPGFPDLVLNTTGNPTPPIYMDLFVGSQAPVNLQGQWKLSMVTCLNKVYNSSQVNSMPMPQDNAVIHAWYNKVHGNGPHLFSVAPYLLKSDGSHVPIEPIQKWISFNVPLNTSFDNVINNDAVNQNVTGTVKNDLNPEFDCTFKEFLIYAGGGQIQGNAITVNQGTACYAAAFYEEPQLGTPTPTPEPVKPPPERKFFKLLYWGPWMELGMTREQWIILTAGLHPPLPPLPPGPGPLLENTSLDDLIRADASINAAVKQLTNQQTLVKLLIDKKKKQTGPEKGTP